MSAATIQLTASKWITEGDVDSSGLQKVIDATRLYEWELADVINAIPVTTFDEIVLLAVTAWERSTELLALVKQQAEWGETDAVHNFSGQLLVHETQLRTVRTILRSLYNESKEVAS